MIALTYTPEGRQTITDGKKGTAMSTATSNESQIREAAYLFWLEEGQPQGRDQEHWLRAVDALSTPAAPAKPKRKAAAKPRAASAAAKKVTKPRAKSKAKPKAAAK